MAVVVFDPEDFLSAFPKFTDPVTGAPLFTDAQLQQAFDVACLLLDNTNTSVVPYAPEQGITTRKTLLYLLVCHLVTLALWPAGQSGPASSATEGSVSVSFAAPPVTGRDYYLLTPCGRTFWQAIQPYVAGGRYYAAKHYHPWG